MANLIKQDYVLPPGVYILDGKTFHNCILYRPSPRLCERCGAPAVRMLCQECLSVGYCSPLCKVQDGYRHAESCPTTVRAILEFERLIMTLAENAALMHLLRLALVLKCELLAPGGPETCQILDVTIRMRAHFPADADALARGVIVIERHGPTSVLPGILELSITPRPAAHINVDETLFPEDSTRSSEAIVESEGTMGLLRRLWRQARRAEEVRGRRGAPVVLVEFKWGESARLMAVAIPGDLLNLASSGGFVKQEEGTISVHPLGVTMPPAPWTYMSLIHTLNDLVHKDKHNVYELRSAMRTSDANLLVEARNMRLLHERQVL